MIEVKNLHKGFEGLKVLKGISATFHPGKTNLIIGQSGSGKTVFLKSLIGLHSPDERVGWRKCFITSSPIKTGQILKKN